MSQKRFAVESLIVLILLLVAAGIWWWKDREIVRAREDAAARVVDVTREAERWAAELAAHEAEAVARSFAAGIAPLVLAERGESVEQAVLSLLEVEAVVFIHVLDSEGRVIASSDRKLTTTGVASEQARWALVTEELTTRPSNRPGVVELAAPIVGPTDAKGYLWMGYDTSGQLEVTRPVTLSEVP